MSLRLQATGYRPRSEEKTGKACGWRLAACVGKPVRSSASPIKSADGDAAAMGRAARPIPTSYARRTPHAAHVRRRERGVALITAVLIVALATILAVSVGFTGFMDQRRTATRFALDQGFQVAVGAEAWAADTLRRDAIQSAKQDDLTEEWATPIPPIPIDGGEVTGFLEDMQGRFNLNSLVIQQGNKFVPHKPAVERLERLLELLELETKWAGVIADWIDSDGEAGFPEGAEDSVYTSAEPAYRTAEMPITRTSELLAISEFGLERYRKLEPFVTALPIGTSINLCTASPELLDSLVAGQQQFTSGRDTVADLRKDRCHPSLNEFKATLDALDGEQQRELTDAIGEKSNYFRSTVWVTIGTTQFTLYSLLYRTDTTKFVRPILRSFGTA
jgi:general secretion pathway protein K